MSTPRRLVCGLFVWAGLLLGASGCASEPGAPRGDPPPPDDEAAQLRADAEGTAQAAPAQRTLGDADHRHDHATCTEHDHDHDHDHDHAGGR